MNMIRFVTPSENLFNQLQFMDIAVKLAGIPIDCRTLAFGHQMLEKIGEVKKINLFIADSAEGFFIKGLVKLDILGSRAGRITARFPGGRSFFVYFQYIQVQAICYQCGIIGHIHDFCPHQHLTLDLEARNSWICIPDCGSPNEDGSTKSVEIEKSTGPHDTVKSQEIAGALNDSLIKTREAFVADADGTEKTLKRKKVYKDKGKSKVSESGKESKKLLLGNKGIAIRTLDEEPSEELVSSTRKNQVPISSKEMAAFVYPPEEKKHKEQGQELEKARSTLVKELFGIPGVETNKMRPDPKSNEDDGNHWVSRIDTYGTNEGTIGEMLREEEGLEKEG
ncbi:hypothetical protein LINPERHAP1_LOCUS27905 [Linum perenne]